MPLKITTEEMEVALARHFNPRQNTIVSNVWWGMGFNYELDLLVVTQSGYAKEIEIKVHKSDLKKDKEKEHDHDDPRIKELYFAVPGDWEIEFVEKHIPRRSGIITVSKNEYKDLDIKKCSYIVDVKKRAIRSFADSLSPGEISNLKRLGYMRYWSVRNRLLHMKRNNK